MKILFRFSRTRFIEIFAPSIINMVKHLLMPLHRQSKRFVLQERAMCMRHGNREKYSFHLSRSSLKTYALVLS
jgi:hypothetical protein